MGPPLSVYGALCIGASPIEPLCVLPSSPLTPNLSISPPGPLRSVAVRAARLWGGYRAAVGRQWGGAVPPPMYAVYKQAHPPTGLEFCLYCHFFGTAERNLVVAGTSQLYVYRLNHDAEVRL